MRATGRRWLVVMVALWPAGAIAQPLDRIDEGIEDVDPLRTSLRLAPIDMRAPVGFDGVYRVSRRDGTEDFARIDGGLVAVFPQSVYTAAGVPVIPAGTIFHIGGLDDGSLIGFPQPAGMPSFNRVDLSAAFAGAEPVRVSEASVPVSLFVSDDHRQRRIAELLGAAARAEQAGR